MANYVPFEQLKVGETYYMYSRYWGEVLGKATIAELHPSSGTGNAYSDWGERNDSTFCFGVDDGFYDCWFWDDMPTKDEIKYQKEHGVRYVAPRIIEGKAYKGGSLLSEELINLLDSFIENLNETFKSDKRFKQDKYDDKHYFMWESKLNYVHPSELFITHGGKCDWDTIRYVINKAEVNIHAGERDGFGWLTGVIDKKMPDGAIKSIIYG